MLKRINIMPKRVKISLAILLSVLLLSLAFGAGCIININQPVVGLDSSLLNQAWGIISQKYVTPDNVTSTMLNQGAVRGMLQSLDDPYSAYLNPQDYQLEQSSTAGSFEGIGAQVAVNKDKQIIIAAPIENSPAAKAGIKAGDIILAVNGKSIAGLSLTEVVLLIRGPAGTKVKLEILHEGSETPEEIEIIRAAITTPSVKYEMRGDILYLRINSFNEQTNGELQTALEAVDLKNTTGIILDLRDNPGGLVTTVVNVASHFIKEGVIITLRDNQGKTDSISTNPNGIYIELPMVVLVNQYSASGSEVLSGALQDYKRATIAGTVTFGKGSYDQFFQLQDGSAIYLTIGRWLTPSGKEIEGNGITPDYTLTQTGEDEILWAIDFLKKAK
jgi:carboxyl-terminal processing protease